MTVIGKLMAFLLLTVGLVLMTWSVGVYVQRPAWFNKTEEGGVDKTSSPVTFELLKADIDALNRTAAVASDVWGRNLKTLEQREAFRADRLNRYAERNLWARKGNPNDRISETNKGKGFYAPVIDTTTSLYDLSVIAGKPKGDPILGTDGQPLPGYEELADSVTADVKAIRELTTEIIKQRRAYDEKSKSVLETEDRLIRMNVIRNSVQAELFFLSSFEVNVYETRETVLRREKQLRGRLKTLGVSEP